MNYSYLFCSEASFRGFDCLLFICCFAVVCYLMKRFDSARYLAAKIGTNSGVFDLMGLLFNGWFMI